MRPARAGTPQARAVRDRPLDLALALACAALALWAQRRALDAYFSIDDLVHFERLRGLLPHTVTLWRWLSNEAYMSAGLAWFGPDPRPYHLINWLLHGTNAALLYALVRALGCGRPGAVLASGLFGASRLYLPALFQAVGLGELLALTGALGALLLALRDDARSRWLALVSFAIALLAKESVAFVPAVLLLGADRAEPWRARLQRAVPLLGLGIVYFGYLYVSNAQLGGARGDAYAMGFGTNLFHNLMTYARWVVDVRSPMPDARTAIDEQAWKVGLWVVVPLVVLALVALRRTRLPLLGLAWFVLALAPILPLLHHTYAYYLYAPLAGIGIALGALFDLAVRSRIAAWALVVVALFAHTRQSDRLTEVRLALRVRGSELALDSFIRKSEVARNIATGLGRGIAGRPGVRALIYRPETEQRMFSATTGQELSPEQAAKIPKYDLVDEVLDRGRVLRALYPSLDTLVMAKRWLPEYRDYDVFMLGAGHMLYPMGRGPRAAESIAGLLVTNGYPERALELYKDALAGVPNDGRLRLQYSYLLDKTGDRAAAIAQLEETMRRSPSSPEAEQARVVLGRMREAKP